MTATRRLGLLGLLSLAGPAGCEAVPSLTFEPGEIDGGEAGGGEAGGDAGDASSIEADASCPTAPPPNAICCGAVPCYGPYCNQTNCAACATCKGTDICCSKTASNAVCGPVCH